MTRGDQDPKDGAQCAGEEGGGRVSLAAGMAWHMLATSGADILSHREQHGHRRRVDDGTAAREAMLGTVYRAQLVFWP